MCFLWQTISNSKLKTNCTVNLIWGLQRQNDRTWKFLNIRFLKIIVDLTFQFFFFFWNACGKKNASLFYPLGMTRLLLDPWVPWVHLEPDPYCEELNFREPGDSMFIRNRFSSSVREPSVLGKPVDVGLHFSKSNLGNLRIKSPRELM